MLNFLVNLIKYQLAFLGKKYIYNKQKKNQIVSPDSKLFYCIHKCVSFF